MSRTHVHKTHCVNCTHARRFYQDLLAIPVARFHEICNVTKYEHYMNDVCAGDEMLAKWLHSWNWKFIKTTEDFHFADKKHVVKIVKFRKMAFCQVRPTRQKWQSSENCRFVELKHLVKTAKLETLTFWRHRISLAKWQIWKIVDSAS